MPEFYTWAILLINQQNKIGEKQLSVFGSRGGQNSPLMHVPLPRGFYFHETSHIRSFAKIKTLAKISEFTSFLDCCNGTNCLFRCAHLVLRFQCRSGMSESTELTEAVPSRSLA